MATRIGLIVTGVAESRALAAALGRLWPRDLVRFEVIPDARGERAHDGFTGGRVDPRRIAQQAALSGADPRIDELAQRLIAAVTGRRDGYDFAIFVEDLELENRGNEADVVTAVREAVVRQFERADRGDAFRARVRERASFHLFDPMLEAYFFAARTTLGRLTASARHDPTVDCERFVVEQASEPEYFREPLGECPRGKKPKDRACPWRGTERLRREHPKRYLQFLLRSTETGEEYCTEYSETRQGAAALSTLAWDEVLEHSAPFLRALVDDLAEMLDAEPNVAGWAKQARSAALTAGRASGVLRNV